MTHKNQIAFSLSGSLIGSACKDCTDRCVGCHSKCEKYLQKVQEAKTIMNKVKAERAVDQYVTNQKCINRAIGKQVEKLSKRGVR